MYTLVCWHSWYAMQLDMRKDHENKGGQNSITKGLQFWATKTAALDRGPVTTTVATPLLNSLASSCCKWLNHGACLVQKVVFQ